LKEDGHKKIKENTEIIGTEMEEAVLISRMRQKGAILSGRKKGVVIPFNSTYVI
jgi:hypothetical protein